MSIEIKVPFPKYEGMEVKKVRADIENGYSVVEYGEVEKKFKKGDIIKSGDVYKDRCIYIFSHISTSGRKVPIVGITADGDLKIYDKNTDRFFGSKPERHANAEERQILFDALAKEGKKWNDDTKEVDPIEKDILVPDNIGIYTLPQFASGSYGDGLFIGFNEDKQLLGYCDTAYCVEPRTKCHLEKVQCKLTPCKREELKEGDTAFSNKLSEPLSLTDKLYCYSKILSNNKVAHQSTDDGGIIIREYHSDIWYKVEPIQ